MVTSGPKHFGLKSPFLFFLPRAQVSCTYFRPPTTPLPHPTYLPCGTHLPIQAPKPHSSRFSLVSSICVRFCNHCISCSSIKGGGRCASVATIVKGGGHYCTSSLQQQQSPPLLGSTFFLFICVRFCHCHISCNNNNVITRRGGGGRGGRACNNTTIVPTIATTTSITLGESIFFRLCVLGSTIVASCVATTT